jgi:hypothetical protein
VLDLQRLQVQKLFDVRWHTADKMLVGVPGSDDLDFSTAGSSFAKSPQIGSLLVTWFASNAITLSW